MVVKNLYVSFALLFASSCQQPVSSICDDGSRCPESLTCQSGGGCVDRSQLEACVTLSEEDTCSTSVAEGVCRSGLCVSANCGDGEINIGEACDDGNEIGGDGCNARCDKIEICGDAIVDEGEACDDGNTNKIDGCDACKTTEWQVNTVVAGAERNAFVAPAAIAVDGKGNQFIIDKDVVRRVDAQSGIITTVAGNGIQGFSGDGGLATSAQFSWPRSIAIDGLGNLFIADFFNSRIRRVDAQNGIITTVAGNGIEGNLGDNGLATSAQLYRPSGIAVDGLGNLFIADYFNNRIRRVDAESGIITTIAGIGPPGFGGFSGDNGPSTNAQLNEPSSIDVDSVGNLYIVDQRNHRIRRIDRQTGVITTVAGSGVQGLMGDGGPATNAQFSYPNSVSVDRSGNLFIADGNSDRVRRVDAITGIINTVAGNETRGFSGDNGAATSAQLNFPIHSTVDNSGNLYIVDSQNYRIRYVDSQSGNITTVSGNDTQGSFGDNGLATSTRFHAIGSVALDSNGNIFLADTNPNVIRRIDAITGIVTTVAGSTTLSELDNSGDTGLAINANLLSPKGVDVDSDGNIFIADTLHHRIRRVDAQSGIITTVVGNGTPGSSGDNGLATNAQLNRPYGIAVDSTGNLFIADFLNFSIRFVDVQTGIITTIAGDGTPGFAGDNGPALSAKIGPPSGLTVDSTGNIFIADTENFRIRRVTPSGIITTVAGNGTPGDSGDNGLATNAQLSGINIFETSINVAVDSNGHLFIADKENGRVRRVDAQTGIITTVAGNGLPGFSGANGLATNASLTHPRCVAIDSQGNLYIGNDRIHILKADDGTLTPIAGSVYPAGMGPIVQAKLFDPKQITKTSKGLMIASGASGTLQFLDDTTLQVVAGRFPQIRVTENWARFRDFDFGAVNGIAVDESKNIAYITEANMIHAIAMIDPDDSLTWTIAPFAGSETAGFADDIVSASLFREPTNLVLDGNRLLVADSGNHVIRAIALDTGIVSTIAGNPEDRGYFGDNGQASSSLLFSPKSMAKCPNGDLFITDTGNHRVRRIEASSGLITTVVGDGVPASSGQGAPSHLFPIHTPLGITCDNAGNIFTTSTNGVRLLPVNEDGVVDGNGPVQTIYGTAPRAIFPESVTRCLTGIISVDEGKVQFADSCVGMLLELELVPR